MEDNGTYSKKTGYKSCPGCGKSVAPRQKICPELQCRHNFSVDTDAKKQAKLERKRQLRKADVGYILAKIQGEMIRLEQIGMHAIFLGYKINPQRNFSEAMSNSPESEAILQKKHIKAAFGGWVRDEIKLKSSVVNPPESAELETEDTLSEHLAHKDHAGSVVNPPESAELETEGTLSEHLAHKDRAENDIRPGQLFRPIEGEEGAMEVWVEDIDESFVPSPEKENRVDQSRSELFDFYKSLQSRQMSQAIDAVPMPSVSDDCPAKMKDKVPSRPRSVRKRKRSAETQEVKTRPSRRPKKKISQDQVTEKEGGKCVKNKKKSAGIYKVKEILDTKRDKGCTWYQIRWEGFSSKDDTWEPSHNIHDTDLISEYFTRMSRKDGNADSTL